MQRPYFSSVKTNYINNRSVFIKSGGCKYDNTCATRLSSALIKSNPNFKKYLQVQMEINVTCMLI